MTKVSVYFIVFDDDSGQNKIIESKILDGLKEYDVYYDLINPKDFVDIENNSFKNQEFKNFVFEKSKGKSISVIASDCNLITIEDFKLQGIDIVSLLLSDERKNYNVPFILYSGKLDEASRHIIEKIQIEAKNIQSNDVDINSIDILKHLMLAKIKFSGRNEDSYCSEIIRLIKSEISIKDIIQNEFNKFGLTKINIGNSEYDGKSLDEIVSLIDNNDIRGQRFIKEFIDLSIANYAYLNE